jgi:stage II sporulation protein AB (anti-sigma F factor)
MPRKNSMEVQFTSNSINESFARITVSAFVSQLDPVMEVLYDIKTAVSEAVTNSIIHGYDSREDEIIKIKCSYEDNEVTIEVIDYGKGISNIEEAMTTLYSTSLDEERAGLGFTVMQTMMDEVEVWSESGKGTVVKMKKLLKG